MQTRSPGRDQRRLARRYRGQESTPAITVVLRALINFPAIQLYPVPQAVDMFLLHLIPAEPPVPVVFRHLLRLAIVPVNVNSQEQTSIIQGGGECADRPFVRREI